jgi:hypothetical protein
MATSESEVKTKSKAHTPYKLKDGTRVPGVTTVVGVLNKPALVPWANKLGLQGIDTRTYVDALAAVGTAAHATILADLSGKGAESALVDLDRITRDLAENCYLSFCAWRNQHELKPIALEVQMVSETWRYGGTADFVGYVDGVLELVDFKTGKGIYPEHFIQLAGYSAPLVENKIINKLPLQYRILNIPRAETEAFDERVKTDLGVEWEIFSHCLAIYWLQKKMGA